MLQTTDKYGGRMLITEVLEFNDHSSNMISAHLQTASFSFSIICICPFVIDPLSLLAIAGDFPGYNDLRDCGGRVTTTNTMMAENPINMLAKHIQPTDRCENSSSQAPALIIVVH
uniref:Uncharacterized protein n=1 Tax=Tanacetum cinerariifolium TaxID=118510 RepID=A0A699JC29_TANCI|nr:hypothetical protein [Tanacetum cinerariifolium]